MFWRLYVFVFSFSRTVSIAAQIGNNVLPSVQSWTKVVGTLELDHVSPIPPNQCWKMSCFLQQKGKKSPDYQHCKWGEGRTCLVSQLFVRDCRFVTQSLLPGERLLKRSDCLRDQGENLCTEQAKTVLCYALIG